MHRSDVALLLGALLVLAGLVLTVVQVLRRRPKEDAGRRASAQVGPVKLALETTYPGLVLVGLGIVLIVIGTLVG